MTMPSLADAAVLRQPELARLLALLDGKGEETRIAGGAVRDTLLGRPVHEVDIATTALPEEVTRRGQQAGFKVVPTGAEHGTVTVVVQGRPFEVTTLRHDVETDGRHALVRFGRDWAEDARRRDFTMNGLYLSRDGSVHDFVGGVEDARAGRVRFIGDATTRIREDYLRILRFFRFFAGYGDGAPDPDAMEATLREREGLRRLSRERVRAEFLKTLKARGAGGVVPLMAEAGILALTLGGVPRLARFRRLLAVEAALGHEADPVLRLGALTLFTREDGMRLHERLRLTNAEEKRLLAMAEGAFPHPALSRQAQHAALYRLGADAFHDRTLLGWAQDDAAPDDEAWRTLTELPAHWQRPVFPVRAEDLVQAGVPRGPQLGKRLRALEEEWIAQDFPADFRW